MKYGACDTPYDDYDNGENKAVVLPAAVVTATAKRSDALSFSLLIFFSMLHVLKWRDQ